MAADSGAHSFSLSWGTPGTQTLKAKDVPVVLNGIGMWVTHSGEGASMNLRSTFLHLAGDLLNSVGVLVSGGLIALTGKLAIDPIVSFLIAGTIVWSAIRLCREAVHVLLEGVPRHLSVPDVEGALGKVPGVEAVHDMHVWTITSGMVALSCQEGFFFQMLKHVDAGPSVKMGIQV